MPLVKRLSDGSTFDGTPDQVEEAVRSGQAEFVEAVGVFNPKDRQLYDGDPAQATEAVRAGGHIEGSRAHKVASTGKLESFGRGAAQGASFGFADELVGALKHVFTDKTYSQARDEYRDNDAIAHEANPITSIAGNVGGSVATSILPFGQVAKGASLWQQAKVGAGLGSIAGLGASEADVTEGDIGGAVSDTLKGAAIGGGTSALVGGAAQGFRTVNDAARKGVGRFFDPTIQRLQAMGAKMSKIKQAGGLQELVPVVEHATNRQIFAKTVDGVAPTPKIMLDRLEDEIEKDVGKMYHLMDAAPIEKLPVEEAWMRMEPKFRMLIEQADPMQAQGADELLGMLEQKVLKTDGDIPSLWDLKKNSGGWANWNADSPVQNQIKKLFNQELNDMVVESVDDIAKSLKIEGLGELNQSYGSLIKLRDYLDDTVDRELFTGGPATAKMSDYVRASAIGAGVGSMTGMPIVGGAAGVVGMAAGAAVRSTQGRLARAKLGEMMKVSAEGLQRKAQTDAAAQAANQIPRTVSGVRQWLQQMGAALPPQFQQVAQKIFRLPDSGAEIEIRALMPLVAHMMAPSPFESEFNGKIHAPQDRIAATQMTKAQGLPPGVASFHLSQLNKTGTLQPYHYAARAEDYGDELLAYNERLTQMGY
jgi:hypothetical protein